MWCLSSRGAGWARVTFIGLSSAAALFFVVLLAYQLALARVPQHRAALERLLQAQTGLDVRFSELGVRWGWYGPEAVFRNVELGEPGRSNVLLRAPELTVGFDAWRTMRSGHLEAGRIALVAPDINLERVGAEPRSAGSTGAPQTAAPQTATAQTAAPRTAAMRTATTAATVTGPSDTPSVARAKLLERWRDGRIDIEGGTLRLPDPGGSANPFLLQIRRASVRRSGDEWNVFALLFLPERLGRTARVAMRLNGGLERPDTLSGSLRFEGRRLSFPGWRDFAGFAPEFARYAPVAGGGDVSVNLDFSHGLIEKADGSVHAGGIVLGSANASQGAFDLDRLHGQWRLVRRGSEWRVRVDTLELTHLDIAGVDIGGTARDVAFNWDGQRVPGQRLSATARLEDVSLTPPSHGFVLSGMTAELSGNEDELAADVHAGAARLELAGAPQYPLDGVKVVTHLRLARADEGWEVATKRLELRHDTTRLELAGTLTGGGATVRPELVARGELTATDVPFVERILGVGAVQTFGSMSASLVAGRIERAEFEVRGPVDELPYGSESGSFAGSVTLRDAVLSGGDQWPDATGLSGRIEWRGTQARAVVDAGHAGPFQLSNTIVEWRTTGPQAGGARSARISGRMTGRVEDAIAWMHDHPGPVSAAANPPGLRESAARIGNFGLEGPAHFDFDVSVPEDAPAHGRIAAALEGVRLKWVSGAVPVQDLTGTLVFDEGRLQRSTLTGTWLGGPVTLRVNERRERDQAVLAMQAHGTMDARQLATLQAVDTQGRLGGSTDWSADFAFLPASLSQPPRWRVRADSALVGVTSELPEPLEKASDASLPLHVDLTGTDTDAQLRVSLGDRLRSDLALQRTADSGWRVERGAVNLGTANAALPVEPYVLVQGRLNRLDLPAYLTAWLAAWKQTRHDARPDSHAPPPIQVRIVAGELLIAGRSYPDVTLVGGPSDSGVQLQIDSESLAGEARWPLVGDATAPAEIHLTRLSLPQRTEPGEYSALIPTLGRAAQLSIDDLIWEGRRVGHVTTTLAAPTGEVELDDMRVSGSTHDGTGTVRCRATLATCRAVFTLESGDVAATLVDFGFRPDLSASQAVLSGAVEWSPNAWPATLTGRLSMKLANGATHAGAGEDTPPFALLAVPALVAAMDTPGSGTPSSQELRFARLEADFDLSGGQASTSDLHFDGDAEILMRGRTGLLARDYDQQVWVLKGEERLPAAVRRFGPTPRVAAAWLTLRELFAATDDEHPRALLRLQGSWDEPVVVSAN